LTAKPAYALVVTPHPDDAEYGIAGTAARWAQEGKGVVYVVCTNGDKGTKDINMKPEVLAKIREKEQLDAAKILGVREVVFLRHPDQGLEDTYEFRKQIVRLIRIYRPDIVATTDPYIRYVWHRDHRITGQVVLDAVSLYARDLLSYPDLMLNGLQPHNVKEILLWGLPPFWNPQEINYRSDITDTFDLKIAALRCHKSQVGHLPSSDLENMLRQQHKAMAKGESFKLAEVFHRVEIFG
jgi:LmbE family N-acetylglucosaminyl deacetylase